MQLCAAVGRLLDISVVVDACHSNRQRHTWFMLLSFKYISMQDSKQACQGMFGHSTNIPALRCNMLPRPTSPKMI